MTTQRWSKRSTLFLLMAAGTLTVLPATLWGQVRGPLTRQAAAQVLRQQLVPQDVTLSVQVCCRLFRGPHNDDPTPPEIAVLQKSGFVTGRSVVGSHDGVVWGSADPNSKKYKLWKWSTPPYFGKGVPAKLVRSSDQNSWGADAALELVLWQSNIFGEVTGIQSSGDKAIVEFTVLRKRAGLYPVVGPLLVEACAAAKGGPYRTPRREESDCSLFEEQEAMLSEPPAKRTRRFALWDDGWRIE